MAVEKKVVLIAEDEAQLRKALAKAFSGAGFEVQEASDGVEGLRLAKEKLPDVILLDLRMPHMGGEEMMQKLNDEVPKAVDVPVIVLTNFSIENRSLAEVVENKATWYLLKAGMTLADVVEKARLLVDLGGSHG